MSIQLAAQRLISTHCKQKVTVSRLTKPVVSFTFDDFPHSAVTYGGEILADRGFRGTYYASMGLMSATTASGPMFTPDDLRELLEVGHELGCHTYDHVACRTISPFEAMMNCERNRQAISDILPGYRVRHFAFPFGSLGLRVKSALSSVYATCRGIYPGINRGRVDVALLRSYSLESVDSAKRAIEHNVLNNGWLVFYTHDVNETPSRDGCTPTLLRNVLRCALDSGADILPVGAALNKLGPQRAASHGSANQI
jgi:peptidoglycan/xylan/chitin deacetylase (PgdA/CDA1 family)